MPTERASARPAFDRVLFASRTVTIGSFRAPVDHPDFADSGPIHAHLFVFPRRAVEIEHRRRRPFVADPGVITLYNRGQRYRRAALSGDGDRCEWFAFAPEVLRSGLAAYEPAVDERPDAPFRDPCVRCDATTYRQQRELTERLGSRLVPGRLEVEEEALAILDRVARLHSAESERRPTQSVPGRHRELAEHARAVLARRFRENLGIADLAAEVGCSPAHLSRIYRASMGTTLHAARTEQRLRAALEELTSGGGDLARIAFDLGFASHSHFTASFRRHFGVSPSGVAARLGPKGGLRRVRKALG